MEINIKKQEILSLDKKSNDILVKVFKTEGAGQSNVLLCNTLSTFDYAIISVEQMKWILRGFLRENRDDIGVRILQEETRTIIEKIKSFDSVTNQTNILLSNDLI